MSRSEGQGTDTTKWDRTLPFIPGTVNLAAFSPFPVPPTPPLDVQPLPSPGASLPFVFDFTGPVLGPPYGNHVSGRSSEFVQSRGNREGPVSLWFRVLDIAFMM